TTSGYVAGRTVKIEFRWAEGRVDRLPGLAAELVGQQVAAIVALGGDPAQAAKAATNTVPIVFVSGTDDGLVASPGRSDGNVTGITWMVPALEGKRLGLLHDVVPNVADIAVLVNPKFPAAENQLKAARAAAGEYGVNILALNASIDRDFDAT